MAERRDQHFEALVRLYETGKTLNAFCEGGCCLSPPNMRCKAMGCYLYGLGDKLIAESGYAEGLQLAEENDLSHSI